MKSNLRYRAFTLLEMTVAMLIAAICMGIAFYVLSTFTRMGESQQREKQAVFMRQLFRHRLQQEFLEAAHIYLIDQTLILDRGDRQTAYTFLDSAVIRSQQDITTDTLDGKIIDFQVAYVADIPQQLVQSCYFKLQTAKEQEPFVLHKTYSAEDLINLPLQRN